VAQLDDVRSVLRLNYETLRGLISLASLSVAKPTHFEITQAWDLRRCLRYGFVKVGFVDAVNLLLRNRGKSGRCA
jgi:hypothetical protein